MFQGLFGFVVCLNLMLKYLLSEVDASSIQLVCCIEVGTSELGHKRDVSVSILGHLESKIQPIRFCNDSPGCGEVSIYITFVIICFVPVITDAQASGLYST